MIYGLHTSLIEILEEGLEARWQRHADAANYLIQEVAPFGFSPFVPENERLNPLTTYLCRKAWMKRQCASILEKSTKSRLAQD
jgi:aspartate aminotransferase-like enzyme